jgi:hypothetical protein
LHKELVIAQEYLRTFYELFIRNLHALVSNDLSRLIPHNLAGSGIQVLEARMFVTAVTTMLCAAGIAFYVRFLVALCRECKPRLIGYWVRLRRGYNEEAIAELQERKKPVTRAA